MKRTHHRVATRRVHGRGRARRARRPLSEEGSRGAIQPVGPEVDVRGGNEDGRRHGRRNAGHGMRRGRQRCTHAARRAGTAFELRKIVEMLDRRQVFRAVVADRAVMAVSPDRGVPVMPARRVVMRLIRWCRCRAQQPMVIRPAMKHGRGREALQGQRDQQQPHQRGTESADHRRSVERMERAGSCTGCPTDIHTRPDSGPVGGKRMRRSSMPAARSVKRAPVQASR